MVITMEQTITPLYNRLVSHDKKKPVSLHVPGHKYGLIHENGENAFFREILKMDATELSGLDDLHSPEGVILEAEALLADAYHAERSYFLVNGSTAGNLAMILAAVEEHDTVFVQRNCHKSILNGLQLAKGNPVFIGPEVYEEWGVAGGVSLKTVKDAFEMYRDCRAIILTYPNYYGIINEIKEIIDFAHSYHIPVLIDEAHGAHFIGGNLFPPSSLELGADAVVQSAHKTLPAMTMGSFLHMNSPYISLTKIEHYLQMLQSSSPSYPIMASLDLARKYIATYTKGDQEYLQKTIAAFKGELKAIKGIKVLEYPESGGDPLKLTIQSETNLTGYELLGLLEKKGIFAELADPYNILFILPLLKEGMMFPFDRVVEGIQNVLNESTEQHTAKKTRFTYFNKEKITAGSLKQTLNGTEKTIPIEKSVNHICAESIIPYPPGVPLLLRGEKITFADVEGLLLLQKTGARFQGGSQLSQGLIKVLD